MVLQALLLLVFTLAVALLIAEDHRNNRLPDCITIPLAIGGLLIALFDIFVTFHSSLLGALIGYLCVQSLRKMQICCRGYSGIGYGDAKYLGALGAWLGIQFLPHLLVGGALIMLICYPHRLEKPFGVGLGLTAFVIHIVNCVHLELHLMVAE